MPAGPAPGFPSFCVGTPEKSEKRTMTGTGGLSARKCSAELNDIASGSAVNVPRSTIPFVWMARSPGCGPWNTRSRAATSSPASDAAWTAAGVPASAAWAGRRSIGAAASASAIRVGRSTSAYALFDHNIEPHLRMDGTKHLEGAGDREGNVDGLADTLLARVKAEARAGDKDLVDVLVIVVDRQGVALVDLDRCRHERPSLLRDIDLDARAEGKTKRSKRRQKNDDAASNQYTAHFGHFPRRWRRSLRRCIAGN